MINPNNGNLTEFTIPTVNGQNAEPYAITLGPDGNLWFTEFMSIQNANGSFANYIGEINPTTHAITQIQLPVAPGAAGAGAGPAGITPGPDGNIWFVEKGIIASEEHPQTGNAVGEVVLGNGKGMKAVGGSSGGGGSSSGTQFGNDINQALQDIVLAVNALRAGNPSLALQDLSGFEFALTAALRDIVQTLSADLTAVAVSLEGGGGRTPLQGFQAAENLLLSDLAQPALQVQRAESSFGALMT